MDRFRNKLVPYIVDRKHINFVKHASLLRIPLCFYNTDPLPYSQILSESKKLVRRTL